MVIKLSTVYFGLILCFFLRQSFFCAASRIKRSPTELNPFVGYSCSEENICLNGGQCLATRYGGRLCNCSDDWMGPQCEFSSSVMQNQLRQRHLVRYMFLNCLNTTGSNDDIQALSAYKACSSGDSVCWLREGGSGAIKVFFWCLNTGYRLLLSEARPNEASRWFQLSTTNNQTNQQNRTQRVNITLDSQDEMQFNNDTSGRNEASQGNSKYFTLRSKLTSLFNRDQVHDESLTSFLNEDREELDSSFNQQTNASSPANRSPGANPRKSVLKFSRAFYESQNNPDYFAAPNIDEVVEDDMP